MWEKIVLNLLSNAFKFTLAGQVAVTLVQEDQQVRLSVRDTGVGIPAHELPRVFERFHRVDGARGRSHEGSGIGLALVQELVKLHGGALTVDSALGQGSVFTVSIPVGAAHLPADHLVPATPDLRSSVTASPTSRRRCAGFPETRSEFETRPMHQSSPPPWRVMPLGFCWRTTTPTCGSTPALARGAVAGGGGCRRP